MAYRLEYEMQDIIVLHTKNSGKFHKIFVLSVLLTVAVIAAHICGMTLQAVLAQGIQMLFGAAESLAESIQRGGSIREAVEVFCAEISR